MLSIRPGFLLAFAPFVALSSLAQNFQAATSTAVPTNQPATATLSGGLTKPDSKTENKILASYGKLPLSFEANQGQVDARVKFFSTAAIAPFSSPATRRSFHSRGSRQEARQTARPHPPALNEDLRFRRQLAMCCE